MTLFTISCPHGQPDMKVGPTVENDDYTHGLVAVKKDTPKSLPTIWCGHRGDCDTWVCPLHGGLQIAEPGGVQCPECNGSGTVMISELEGEVCANCIGERTVAGFWSAEPGDPEADIEFEEEEEFEDAVDYENDDPYGQGEDDGDPYAVVQNPPDNPIEAGIQKFADRVTDRLGNALGQVVDQAIDSVVSSVEEELNKNLDGMFEKKNPKPKPADDDEEFPAFLE